MRYQPIDPQLFITNRRRLQERLENGQAIVLRAAKPTPGQIDDSHPYRQDSNFFWITGIDQTDSVAVITKDTETLYARFSANEFERTWLDARLSAEQASEISGIQDIRTLGAYRKPETAMDHSKLLAELRMIKQPQELELIKQSIAITADGLRDLRAAVKVGAIEYELEAEFTRQVIRRGAANAWPPVVASGSNTCVIHYGNNNRSLESDDILLVDLGAEYAHYDADVSRTYAVTEFSPRQQAVYDAVLRVHDAAIAALRPGVNLMEYEREIADLMFGELKELGLVTKADRDRDKRGMPKWRRFFPHRTSHHLGLDPHDAANYELPLQANMVLTVEPGIYIPAENIGVRIEDDILITQDGAVNITAHIPL